MQWLGYESDDQRHWFGVRALAALWACLWEATPCGRQFSYAPAEHETWLGVLPRNTTVSQRLLQQVRPWIEPAQSYEKNQLGLSQAFLNSLRLTWAMCLLADAAVLLRAHALLRQPPAAHPLEPLLPIQLAWDFEF